MRQHVTKYNKPLGHSLSNRTIIHLLDTCSEDSINILLYIDKSGVPKVKIRQMYYTLVPLAEYTRTKMKFTPLTLQSQSASPSPSLPSPFLDIGAK
jgi:hypothetical protein